VVRLRRFHASAHSPGETVCGISRTIGVIDFNAVAIVVPVT
jgi:hypothetical protein